MLIQTLSLPSPVHREDPKVSKAAREKYVKPEVKKRSYKKKSYTVARRSTRLCGNRKYAIATTTTTTTAATAATGTAATTITTTAVAATYATTAASQWPLSSSDHTKKTVSWDGLSNEAFEQPRTKMVKEPKDSSSTVGVRKSKKMTTDFKSMIIKLSSLSESAISAHNKLKNAKLSGSEMETEASMSKGARSAKIGLSSSGSEKENSSSNEIDVVTVEKKASPRRARLLESSNESGGSRSIKSSSCEEAESPSVGTRSKGARSAKIRRREKENSSSNEIGIKKVGPSPRRARMLESSDESGGSKSSGAEMEAVSSSVVVRSKRARSAKIGPSSRSAKENSSSNEIDIKKVGPSPRRARKLESSGESEGSKSQAEMEAVSSTVIKSKRARSAKTGPSSRSEKENSSGNEKKVGPSPRRARKLELSEDEHLSKKVEGKSKSSGGDSNSGTMAHKEAGSRMLELSDENRVSGKVSEKIKPRTTRSKAANGSSEDGTSCSDTMAYKKAGSRRVAVLKSSALQKKSSGSEEDERLSSVNPKISSNITRTATRYKPLTLRLSSDDEFFSSDTIASNNKKTRSESAMSVAVEESSESDLEISVVDDDYVPSESEEGDTGINNALSVRKVGTSAHASPRETVTKVGTSPRMKETKEGTSGYASPKEVETISSSKVTPSRKKKL